MAKLTITGAREDIEYIKEKLSKNLAVALGDIRIKYSGSEDRSAYNKAYYKAHRNFILLQHRQRARRKSNIAYNPIGLAKQKK